MKGLHGTMTVIGFAIPAFLTYAYTLENPDNLLFIMHPAKTIEPSSEAIGMPRSAPTSSGC
jgi:hypothetical protein